MSLLADLVDGDGDGGVCDSQGPIAGDRVGVHGVGISKVEVSEAACPQMMQHSIGGNAMVRALLIKKHAWQ